MSRQHALICGCLSLALFGVAAGPANGQTRTVQASRHFNVARTQLWSSYSVRPQIQPDPPFVLRETAAENDYTPPLPPEPPNGLTAGGMLSSARGSIRRYFPGPVDNRFVPPDCGIAVGPSQIVATINTTIAFYSKSGTKTFQTTMDGASGFFAGVAQTSFVFDPKSFYDPISQRFFVIADELDQAGGISNILLAVSDDNNPNGNWFKYRINAVLTSGGATYWLDYPGFGFNKDAVVVTGNMFGFASGVFGSEALVIKKSSVLAGGTASVAVIQDPTSFTIQPTRTPDSAIDTIYGVAQGGGNAMRFYAFRNLTSATPTLSEIDVPVPSYSGPGGAAASGGNQLDALDGRTMSANYRAGHVVSGHTINTGSAIAVRWYDFKPNSWPTSGSPTLNQSGNITQSGASIHMPAVNTNSAGDISVVFTRSSSSIPADVCYAGRFASDPNGQMGAIQKLVGSTSASYTGFRWGDYFGNEVDPADDTTFWAFGMTIANDGTTTTQINSFQISSPGGANGTPVGPNTIDTTIGTFLAGDTTSVTTSDDINYQVASTAIPQFGSAAGVICTFTVPTDTRSMSVNLESTAGVPGGTNMVWLWNRFTDRWDLIGSVPLSASGNPNRVITVRAANVPKYIGPTGEVQAIVRGHIPKRPFQQQPPPFTYSIDLLQLLVR